MERGSDTHGPMMDEELRRQTESLERGAPVESRSEEEREEAPPGDGEPASDQRLRGGRPAGLDDAEARSELARFLQPSVGAIRTLPESKVYDNVQSVWEDLTGSSPD